MEDYKYKYLKYKNKYLSLKQTMSTQTGGNPIIENPVGAYKNKSDQGKNPDITITQSVLMILEQTKLVENINQEEKLQELNQKLNDLLTVSKTETGTDKIDGYTTINKMDGYTTINKMDGYTTINIKILYDINILDQDTLLSIEMALLIIMLQIYTNYFPKNIRTEPGFIEKILQALRISKTYKDGQEYDLHLGFIINLLKLFTTKEQKIKFVKFLLNPYYANLKNLQMKDSKYTLWDILSIREMFIFNGQLTLKKKETEYSKEEQEKYNLLNNAITFIKRITSGQLLESVSPPAYNIQPSSNTDKDPYSEHRAYIRKHIDRLAKEAAAKEAEKRKESKV